MKKALIDLHLMWKGFQDLNYTNIRYDDSY